MEEFRDPTVKWGEMTGRRWREKRRAESGLNLKQQDRASEDRPEKKKLWKV